jgi:hypothetical protein
MIGTELGSVAVGQAQGVADTNCYSSPALEPVRRYLKRPYLVFTATHARFGPTTPTRDTGLPLALRRLDRLPSCRTVFAAERLSPSTRGREDPRARRIKLKSLRHPLQVKRPFTDQRLAVKTGDPAAPRPAEAYPDLAVGGDPDIISIITDRDRFLGR